MIREREIDKEIIKRAVEVKAKGRRPRELLKRMKKNKVRRKGK